MLYAHIGNQTWHRHMPTPPGQDLLTSPRRSQRHHRNTFALQYPQGGTEMRHHLSSDSQSYPRSTTLRAILQTMVQPDGRNWLISLLRCSVRENTTTSRHHRSHRDAKPHDHDPTASSLSGTKPAWSHWDNTTPRNTANAFTLHRRYHPLQPFGSSNTAMGHHGTRQLQLPHRDEPTTPGTARQTPTFETEIWTTPRGPGPCRQHTYHTRTSTCSPSSRRTTDAS